MNNTLKKMLAVGATIALLGAGCAGSAPAQDSPSAVVNSFMTAVQKGDKEGARSVVDMEGEFGQNFDDAWEEISSLTVTEYTVGSVDGNEVKVEMTVEENGETDESVETFEVVERDGKWWLVEP